MAIPFVWRSKKTTEKSKNLCAKYFGTYTFRAAGQNDAFNLKLAPGQEEHVSHPIRSLAQAYVYRNQCQPFGIYAEDKIELVVRV